MNQENGIKATLIVLSNLQNRASIKKQETLMENSSKLNDTLQKHDYINQKTHSITLEETKD